jgi:maltose-binding protein MalE
MFNWQYFAICFCAVFVSAVNAQERIELAFGQTGYDFTPILNQFEEETGIKIITAPQDQYDLKAKLIKSSERKNFPDVFIAPADYTTIKTITLQEVTEAWLDPNVSSKALQTVTNDNSISAIPLIAGNHLLLYFNRGIISKPATNFSQLESQLD